MAYINWDAINRMSEEEAAGLYDGLLETFCGRKAMSVPLTDEELAAIRERWPPDSDAGKLIAEVDRLALIVQRVSETFMSRTEEARYKSLLMLAVDTIEGLSDQQAMSDDWYKQPLEEIRAAVKGTP